VATASVPRLRETPRALGAVVALGMMAFLYVTTETLPIGLLPQIAQGVDVSIPRAGFLVTGYAGTVAVVSVPLALWTRKMDRRRLLLAILGVYVVAVLGTAVAPNYGLLLGARIVTALSQAIFWAIVGPTAASLFVPALRSRVLSLVFVGSSLAIIVGTPTGTWLGQHGGWRVSFAVLAVIGLAILGAVSLLVPRFEYHESHAATGAHPDARRYALLVVVTAAGMAGYFTMSTYMAPFLTEVTGLPDHAVSLVLLAGGVAGVGGVMATPRLLARSARLALAVPVAWIVIDFLLLFAFAHVAVVAVPLLVLGNASIAAFATALTSYVLDVAPGSSDVASAGTSSAFNVGIGGGAALGALAVHLGTVRGTALMGALTTSVALGVLLAEPRLARMRLRRSDT
jgi:DHA1 family inner membrane transport protein